MRIMMYSLRSKLLVTGMDVSRCILVLDTSIFATSNLERREYGRRAQGVIELAAKTTCFVEFSVSMVGLSGMKDRMSKLRESSEDNVEI